jgi:YrbI family 3-deoxy-D-manno-octulosonate 8-phosphate phosphatase
MTWSTMGPLDNNQHRPGLVPVRLIVLDIDGVLTDGSVQLRESGDEARSVHFHDVDAVASVQRRGVKVAVLSGEETAGVQRVARRLGISEGFFGAKEKLSRLSDLTSGLGIALEETCYVGDADRDAPALQAAGIAFAPADATVAARSAADFVLTSPGGRGAVAEAIEFLQRTGRLAAGAIRSQSLERRLGIMQGRLVPSTTGELDCSPGPRWREEFWSASALRLGHIELVAERQPDPSNPIWSADGRREILALSEVTGVRSASLCLNEPLVASFEETAAQLVDRITPVLNELPVHTVVVPLLEASDLRSSGNVDVARTVGRFAEQLPDGLGIAVELGLSADDGLQFLDAVGHPRVGLCYDVGNAAASGFDPADELRILGSAVRHVHAKDKNDSKENVRFGAGRVKFARVLQELSHQGFDGLITMEATRGNDPFRTAAEHRDFLVQQADTTYTQETKKGA